MSSYTKDATKAGDTVDVADRASTIDQEISKSAIVATDEADAGLELYSQALELDAEHLQRLARRVRWKLDFILLPLMVCLAS
jgi:hypothetical protein